MPLNRRKFLKKSAVTGAGVAHRRCGRGSGGAGGGGEGGGKKAAEAVLRSP